MNGFLCIIKPPGMTSAQVVGEIKRLFPGDKIGHGGTLDPQTAGVLPIMVGKATRLFDYMLEKEKVYIAEITFGIETDTQDSQGKIISKSSNYPSKKQIINALNNFEGEISQIPPGFSALKVNGVRAYDLARRGEQVDLKARKVFVYDIKSLWFNEPNQMGIKVRCSKGTYIRTLCADVGEALGCPAHMSFLLRSQSGAFSLQQGKTLEEVIEANESGRLEKLLLPLDFPVNHFHQATLPENQVENFLYGRPMDRGAFLPLEDDQVFRLYDKEKLFLGMAHVKGNQVRIKTYLQGINHH